MKNKNLSIPIEWVDSGLHTWPEKLHTRIMEVLDSLPKSYSTVLLLFGFCGNSLVGIKAKERTIVLPVVADCIPIYLGSRQKQTQLGPHNYYFTSGYLDSERTFITELEEMKKRYGEARAIRYGKKMLAHYKQLSVIDTGAYDVLPVAEKIRAFADQVELPVNIITGNLCIIEKLLLGDWDSDDFLIVEPGSEISFDDSLRAGKSQI